MNKPTLQPAPELILCSSCGHDIDQHGPLQGCFWWDLSGEPMCECAKAPSTIAREYAEAYEHWKEFGEKAHRVLLDIWRVTTPDSKHLTYGDDPSVVFDAFKAGIYSRQGIYTPTAEEIELAARQIWLWFVGEDLSGFDRPAHAPTREKCMGAAQLALISARRRP